MSRCILPRLVWDGGGSDVVQEGCTVNGAACARFSWRERDMLANPQWMSNSIAYDVMLVSVKNRGLRLGPSCGALFLGKKQ